MRPWANQPANSGAHARIRASDLEDVVPVGVFFQEAPDATSHI